MRYGDDTKLSESFAIQKRVINALLMREVITRYGRDNLGVLWLFVEPLLVTLFFILMWSGIHANQTSTLNIVAFSITGYPLLMMWRNGANRTMNAVNANISLLYHRNVRVLDTLITRLILEISGTTIAQIAIMAVFIVLGWIPMPTDIFYMLLAWGLMALFAVGLGLVLCSIAHYFEFFGKLWSSASILMMPLSGAFFFVHSLPPKIQEYALYLPMIHGSEMFRHGYFGSTVTTYEDPLFILQCDLVLIFLGLLLVKRFSQGVEPT